MPESSPLAYRVPQALNFVLGVYFEHPNNWVDVDCHLFGGLWSVRTDWAYKVKSVVVGKFKRMRSQVDQSTSECVFFSAFKKILFQRSTFGVAKELSTCDRIPSNLENNTSSQPESWLFKAKQESNHRCVVWCLKTSDYINNPVTPSYRWHSYVIY